ncbi:hypothetical protein D915_006883 [Fasciola hepatica]|uniref:alanine--tRNA ligase n=1 Tax=Fasciola hepatica TaxID=6192 RepID=A0A4E0R8R1_FASHE|nr:hypothetical protein D915_006883 [Fasciola hepatica]
MLCAQSHWFGLCVPEAPLSSSSLTSCTPAPSSSSRANTSTPTHQSQSRPDQSVAMAEQLYLANFKPSDDTAKYNYVRQNSSLDSASGYDIPTIEARLLAVFVNDAEANRTHLLRSTDDVSHVSLNSNQILSGRVGLVFDQTNFFASAGGQDSDKGVIRLSSSDTEFEVVDVESVPNPKEPQHFWIVHWCLLRIPVGRSPTPAQFQFDQPYALQVDSERRVQLMRNHTAQHLFAWAVEQVALSNQSDGFRELQHQGGSVHPDRFVVNTALVDQASTRAVEQDAVGFVRHLENLCRDVIRQRLDVRRVQTKWSSVVKNSKVRRFPWMDYPDIVTAVCIGKPIVLESSSTETAESATPNSSAELCAGTHVVNTADLIDLVVVALRDRKQAVKQFVGIVGEPARQARLRGDSLLASAQNREARIATHPSELSEHIDWLTTELAQHADHLPYADRECLQACLLRLRTQRNLGSSAELDVQQIKQLVSHMRTEITQTNGIVQIGSNPPYRPELVAVAISQLEPSHTVIVCSGRTAVCYFPHHTSIPSHSASFSALDLAHRIAHYLTTVHSEILSPGQVKARPVRSNSISAEFLMKLASLQLMVDGRNWADAELCTVLECALNDAVLANQSRSVP